MQTYIDQSPRDFSALNDQISELDSQLIICNEIKKKNKALLEENTEANQTITNFQSWIEMLNSFLLPGKRDLSKK